ncbi:hypothetical protein WMY93_023463 [Mugilogobius chulae]|uniref:Reverse transcriptase domain-containing protein n=1 Tax=Mugilogobius chulae TaxID=88201 RepID=A0AAW0N8R8_9GOBI
MPDLRPSGCYRLQVPLTLFSSRLQLPALSLSQSALSHPECCSGNMSGAAPFTVGAFLSEWGWWLWEVDVFDTIQPQLLKGKLERMGVDPVFVRWMHKQHRCTTRNSCHVQKYSDDTAIVACVKGRDESEYRELITRFTSWSRENALMLNTSKTKEMMIDFGRKPTHQPVIIDGEKIEVVDTYKYLGVHLDHELDWSEQAWAL